MSGLYIGFPFLYQNITEIIKKITLKIKRFVALIDLNKESISVAKTIWAKIVIRIIKKLE